MDGRSLNNVRERAASLHQAVDQIAAALRLARARLPEHASQHARNRAICSQVQHRHERVRAGQVSLVRRILRPTLPGGRSQVSVGSRLAEARYFAWDRLSADEQFPVKGYSLNDELILGNAQRARPFMGGTVFLAWLAPVDYHRAHYFDDGRTLDHDRLGRRLWTVNPHALHNKQDILFVNERNINI